VLAGVVLGEAAVRAGHWAVQTQSYGPEARGGAARSEVLIADEPIDYPRVLQADVLVALSQPGYDRFAGELAAGGLVIVEEAIVDAGAAPDVRAVPFLRTAEEAGHKIVANVVMVAYLNTLLDIAPPVILAETVLDNVPAGTEELNRRAVRAGQDLLAGSTA
jgi:2-oxoglutarate ferredoxin oxidoreductase subunit gamma